MTSAYRQLAGVCVCGTHYMVRYGGSARMDTWGCCSPWLDPIKDEIVGYGWDMRSDRRSPPGKPRSATKKRPPAEPKHPLLAQIGAAPQGMTSCVYERMDADGVHLYVGVSDSPLTRAKTHLKKSTWFLFAASGTERWFSTRAEAEKVERLLIKDRRPLFNRQHADPEAHEALVRYLVNKGRFDLLQVAATWG